MPLAAVRDGASWVLVGSNAGKGRMPDWVHNLRAEPARLRGAPPEHAAAFRAREVTDRQELAARWRQVVAGYPGYAVYRQRTERVIPLFVLEPA